ncbi:DapH/DapD/GlmU-related protein [Sporolactobacillus pectinivorans]|uniref:DapH/DapD/GlmU-related protein n=1 Tax=Sporolactobacillus pectinivorans TaxID=1591408 RepID=UPI000C269C52|nr:DapH/DapD/GlmU-related protein [Sporolactobacillus pectinivorans]
MDMTEHRLLSEQPTIDPSSTVINSRLGSWTDIGPNTKIEETEFGDYSYTDGDATIIYSSIGKFCSIASHVRINPGNHPMWRVTQHHLTYRRIRYQFAGTDDETIFNWRRGHKVTIGNDVWIGHSATIMPGVTIGTGAVVGAGAVVTKDIEPYTIAVGVPARPLRQRFSGPVIEELLKSQWWNWDRRNLEDHFHELCDVDSFLKLVREGR